MLNKLIKLANDLDKKGLRKEADQLDKIIKKYAGLPGQKHSPEDRPQPPEAQTFVRKINFESQPSKNQDHLSENPSEANYTNLFTFEKANYIVIEEGIIFDDHGLLCIYRNTGSGTKEEKEAELEKSFPGITSKKGHSPKKSGSIYNLKLIDDGNTLELIYDTFM